MTGAAPPFLFVVGCGRSGTTLLAALLDSHPSLAVAGESGGMVLQFCHGLPASERPDRLDWPPVEERGEPYGEAEIRSLVDEITSSYRYRLWGLDPEAVVAAAVSASAASRTDLVRALFASYAALRGKHRYADKTPGHALHLVRLAELFPEGVFVHVIRDGRDVALSMVEMSWGPTDIAGAALHWADRVSRARQAGASLGPGRYLEVRYEDLISDTAVVLARVAAHAGLDYDPAMLAHEDAAARQVAMSPAPDEDRNITRPITGGLRDWRMQMDPVDVATFEALAGPLLGQLGYPTGSALPAAGAAPRVTVGARAEKARAALARLPAAAW